MKLLDNRGNKTRRKPRFIPIFKIHGIKPEQVQDGFEEVVVWDWDIER